MFVLSSTLNVYDRDGAPDEMPLDDLFVEDGSSIVSGVIQKLDREAIVREIEAAVQGARVARISLIARGGYHDVGFLLFRMIIS